MSRVALVVEFEVDGARMAEFLRLTRDFAAAVLAEQPECSRFDVMRPRDGGDRVFLYEVHASDDSFQSYRTSPLHDAYRAAADPMIRKQTVAICDLP